MTATDNADIAWEVCEIHLEGNAPIEVFPFVTIFHREVVLRHHDGESQDIELTPDEADMLADRLRAAAATTRARQVDLDARQVDLDAA